ncbi:MAG: hypothetical protein JW908_12805 [Anaerolineales bacterium]|nr:hypothetical protein [Anaerolineales bacterium]
MKTYQNTAKWFRGLMLVIGVTTCFLASSSTLFNALLKNNKIYPTGSSSPWISTTKSAIYLPMVFKVYGPVIITVQVDGLKCSVFGETVGYSFKWHRNSILLMQETNSLLTNSAMRTYDGNPIEYTPRSSHTGHTTRGFEFKCEAFDDNENQVGDASVFINDSLFSNPIKGVSLVYFDDAWATQEKIDHTLVTIQRTHLNWVSSWTFHFQDSITSTIIYSKNSGFPNTMSDQNLIYQINKAHQLGLKVALYPQIWITYPDGSASPDERPYIIPSDEWFTSYKNFILGRADIAEQTGVELFTIGVELESTMEYSDKWFDIISSIRNHYHGPIVYSAIACNQPIVEGLKNISWFNALDYVGLSANLQTRSGNFDPSVSELVAVYETMAITMKEVHDIFDKPILFTETIIPSLDGGTISPGDWKTDVADFQEQADFYDAFFQTFANKSWVEGVFGNTWNASQESWYQLDPGWAFGCTFLNKPAERVLTSWYGGTYRGP